MSTHARVAAGGAGHIGRGGGRGKQREDRWLQQSPLSTLRLTMGPHSAVCNVLQTNYYEHICRNGFIFTLIFYKINA